jgi:ribosome maturation factor RimP
MSDTPVIQRVRSIVDPIASDLGLDPYDVEQRGGTIRVTLDTPPGSDAGVDLEQLALATRLISRELDHQDPVPGHYTLEVTSPGVERNLRTPAHFQREVGKTISIRLAAVDADQRRLEGVLVAADDTTATIRIADTLEDRVVELATIDRARTVFVWGPQPKPGGKRATKKQSSSSNVRAMPKPAATNGSAASTPTAKSASKSASKRPSKKESS